MIILIFVLRILSLDAQFDFCPLKIVYISQWLFTE